MAYLHPVHAWISQAEIQLTDQLERASSKGFGQSSRASSRLSARDKERVERSMLKQKHSLRAAEEDLELELEIVKAEARERALDERDKEQVPLLSSGMVPPSVVTSFSPIVVPSVPASSLDDVALNPKTNVSTVQTPAAAATQATSSLQGPRATPATVSAVKTSLPNPNAAEFIPAAFKNGTSPTPYNVHGRKNSEEIGHGISEIQLPLFVSIPSRV